MILTNSDSVIVNNRYTIKTANILEAAICPQTSVSYNNNTKDEIPDFLLCLRLKSPQRIPGSIFLLKHTNVAFPIEADETAQISSLPFFKCNTAFPDEIPLGDCIIEAKKSSNNYTRAGTTGTHPYDRAGIISPVILAHCNLNTGKMLFKYIGTTSRLVKSEYFSQNPEIIFDFSNAEVRNNSISVLKKGCTASVQFLNPSIEKDESKTGVWSVCVESHFDSICQAANWINCFYKKSSCNDDCLQENISVKNVKLLEQLKSLYDAGVLSEEEWIKKSDYIKRKDTP